MSISQCLDSIVSSRLEEFLNSFEGETITYEVVSVVNRYLPYVLHSSEDKVKFLGDSCYIDSELWEFVKLGELTGTGYPRRVWVGNRLDESFVIEGKLGVMKPISGDVQIAFATKKECEDYYSKFLGNFKIYQIPLKSNDWYMTSRGICEWVVDFKNRYSDVIARQELSVQMVYLSWLTGLLRSMNFIILQTGISEDEN